MPAEDKSLIYSTDEENLFFLPLGYNKPRVYCEVYRCQTRKIPQNLTQIPGNTFPRKHIFAQYEVWKVTTAYNGDIHSTEFIGLFNFLNEALGVAHGLADSKEILHSTYLEKTYESPPHPL